MAVKTWMCGAGAAAGALAGGAVGYIGAEVWADANRASPAKSASWKFLGSVFGTAAGAFLAGISVAKLAGGSSGAPSLPKVSPAGTSIALTAGANGGVSITQGSTIVLNVPGSVTNASSDTSNVQVVSTNVISATLRGVAPGLSTITVNYTDLNDQPTTSTISITVQ